LPSVRRLVRQKGVSASPNCALRALEHGIRVARPQSGYFAKPPRLPIDEPVTTPPLATGNMWHQSSVMGAGHRRERVRRRAVGCGRSGTRIIPCVACRVLASTVRHNPRLLGHYGLAYHGVDSLRIIAAAYADIAARDADECW